MIRRAPAIAVAVAVIVILLGGCGTRRIAECDDYLSTIDRLSTCSELPELARGQIEASARTMREALTMLDDRGGASDAPADLVSGVRETCRSQNRAILDEYAKLLPACLN